MSFVTALELLAGLGDIPPEKFPKLRGQVELASNLTNGRILEEPRYLLCTEVLRIPFPSEQLPPSAHLLKAHMDIVRRERSLHEVRQRMKNTAAAKEVAAGPKAQWKERVEEMATKNYPSWRELFQQTGRRLPSEMRRALEQWPVWEAHRLGFVESMLEWLGAKVDSESLTEMNNRLDAVLQFTIFVAREFLISNYSLEKHESDVFDQFQLQYMAMDRSVIVSNDPDLTNRTKRSSQAHRIMSFERFLQTL